MSGGLMLQCIAVATFYIILISPGGLSWLFVNILTQLQYLYTMLYRGPMVDFVLFCSDFVKLE